MRPLRLVPVPRLLDHIGLAMYSKFAKAIGELVVNGYDADATEVHVRVSAEQISIKDNGTGMDEIGIRDSYMSLGANIKRKIRLTKKFSRLPIGNKGVGKLAGLGIANKINICTIKDGKQYSFSMDREELKKKKTLEKALFNDFTARGTSEENGTTVVLTKIFPHVKIDIESLRGNLARDLPYDEDFKILVNEEICTRKDMPAKKRIPIDEIVGGCGRIYGEIIVAKKSLTSIQPGVITTVRGRAVGKPSLFGVYKSKHRFYQSLAQLITGSIEVPGFDPVDESADERPVIQTDREGFAEDHPAYIAYHDFMTDLILKICKEEEDEFNQKTEIEKEEKVREALKNVIEDFNEYNKEYRHETKSVHGKAREADSDQTIFKETLENPHDLKNRAINQKANPVGITDKKKREALSALIGEGSINLGGKRYKVITQPLGIDDFECRIDDAALLIVINSSHPAYNQAVIQEATELIVFRAIANAFASKESETPIQMYEKIDEMLRFQARRLGERKENKIGELVIGLLSEKDGTARKKISDREYLVLKMRLGLGGKKMTLQEIGTAIGGITRERVRQIEKQALKKIKS